jgi:hypothetical protein
MRAFEIHTFAGGKWKIDSVFDDRELAVFEAQRIDESNRYAGVRVIEENFDEQTQKSTVKTIFRGGRVDAEAARAPSPRQQATAQATPRGGSGTQRGNRKPSARPVAKPQKSNAALLTTLAVIVVVGVVAMVTLHFLPKLV